MRKVWVVRKVIACDKVFRAICSALISSLELVARAVGGTSGVLPKGGIARESDDEQLPALRHLGTGCRHSRYMCYATVERTITSSALDRIWRVQKTLHVSRSMIFDSLLVFVAHVHACYTPPPN